MWQDIEIQPMFMVCRFWSRVLRGGGPVRANKTGVEESRDVFFSRDDPRERAELWRHLSAMPHSGRHMRYNLMLTTLLTD